LYSNRGFKMCSEIPGIGDAGAIAIDENSNVSIVAPMDINHFYAYIYKEKQSTLLKRVRRPCLMSKKRIFIVEDDDIIARLIEWRVKELGYDVCGRAATGDDAVSLIRSMPPDLVLLDIGLPGKCDGISVAQEIRKTLDLPIVFVTCHSHGEIIDRAKKTSPNGFILKPFSDDDLRVAIELAL